MTKRNSDILLSKSFIIGLLILILNDFVFKQTFSNTLTGKLSDFSGLFVFPMFLTFLFPNHKRINYILTFLGFVLWKLPITDSFINFWNSFCFFNIHRVVDYTDYLALLAIPISYSHSPKPIKLKAQKIVVNGIGVIAFIAFCSTAGTHGSMGGYKYPISKDSLESAINQVIIENEHIERSLSDTSDYYNTGGYITININKKEQREYTFRFYGGEEHWKSNPSQSEIFICYAMHNGYAQSEGNDVSDELKEQLVAFFEKEFIQHLDKKLGIKHVKTD